VSRESLSKIVAAVAARRMLPLDSRNRSLRASISTWQEYIHALSLSLSLSCTRHETRETRSNARMRRRHGDGTTTARRRHDDGTTTGRRCVRERFSSPERPQPHRRMRVPMYLVNPVILRAAIQVRHQRILSHSTERRLRHLSFQRAYVGCRDERVLRSSSPRRLLEISTTTTTRTSDLALPLRFAPKRRRDRHHPRFRDDVSASANVFLLCLRRSRDFP